jgi:hypothetical protein
MWSQIIKVYLPDPLRCAWAARVAASLAASSSKLGCCAGGGLGCDDEVPRCGDEGALSTSCI